MESINKLLEKDWNPDKLEYWKLIMPNTCETCRFWLTHVMRQEAQLGLGLCGYIPDFLFATEKDPENYNRRFVEAFKNRKAFTHSTMDSARFLPLKDFGCNQWQQRIFVKKPLADAEEGTPVG